MSLKYLLVNNQRKEIPSKLSKKHKLITIVVLNWFINLV